jgi:hypothetical protein
VAVELSLILPAAAKVDMAADGNGVLDDDPYLS